MEKHEAIEVIKKNCPDSSRTMLREALETLIPELKEIEDEKIRKMLIRIYKKADMGGEIIGEGITYKQVINWLEKQGKQETNNFKPKFEVGDWIVINNPCQIESMDSNGNYIVRYCDAEETHLLSGNFCDSHFHLWTIEDAKDGDVLADDRAILLFRSIGNRKWKTAISYYTILETNLNNRFSISNNEEYWGMAEDCELEPATKEQRDLLFSKMKEADYVIMNGIQKRKNL